MDLGQWMWGRDGRRWFFRSGSLALDFGYTGDYGYRQPEWERLHKPADLQRWIGDRFGALARPLSGTEFRDALDLRAAISALAVAAADAQNLDPRHIDAVNEAVRRPPVRPHLAGGSTGPLPRSIDAVLSTVAEDAVAILTMPGHRVRRCSGAGCELIFFDHSRPNGRRWCSMARCGNRAKMKAHRADGTNP